MTNNFAINKGLFAKILFNEELSGYGHEDTLFGFELKKINIHITHIDNPVLNNDLEKTSIYIKNTENSIENLYKILLYKNFDQELIQDINLLAVFYRMKPFHWLLKLVFKYTKDLIKRKLINHYGCLLYTSPSPRDRG